MIDFISPKNQQECQRLFHGRGHSYEGLSHINIDWFKPVVLISLYKEVEPEELEALASQLMDSIPSCLSIQVQRRYLKFSPVEVIKGQQISNLITEEHGLKYNIELGKNQNCGLFLDMRNGRKWIQKNSADLNVLNLFAYTCSFSVAAIAGSAQQVVNIDWV